MFIFFINIFINRRIFYINYRKPGDRKKYEERLGTNTQDWTAAKANAERMKRINGLSLTNVEKRQQQEAAILARREGGGKKRGDRAEPRKKVVGMARWAIVS